MPRHHDAPMRRTRSDSPSPTPTAPAGVSDHPFIDADMLLPPAWQWQAYELRVAFHMAATYTTALRGS